MEIHAPDIFGELNLAGSPGLAGQVPVSQGAGNQVVWGGVGGNSVSLPAPVFRVLKTGTTAYTIGGDILETADILQFRTMEVPNQLLTDLSLQAQIELLRYRSPKMAKSSSGIQRKKRAGWVHPVHYVGGVTPAHQGGTRRGAHSVISTQGAGTVPVGDRPSEWPVAGLAQNQSIDIRLGDIFANWFRVAEVEDAAGGAIRAWLYSDGRGYSKPRSEANALRAGRATNIGRFAFRYSYFDASLGRRVVGVPGLPFVVRVALPLYRMDMPSGVPYQKIVNPNADSGSGAAGRNVLQVRFGDDLI